jgi:hypothetical protein
VHDVEFDETNGPQDEDDNLNVVCRCLDLGGP